MGAKPKKSPSSKKKPEKKGVAAAEKVRCTCQSATHGHRPGKCVSMTTESDRLCKFCHNMAAADAAKDPAKTIDPMNQPRSAR